MRDRSPVFADETRQIVGAVFSWRLIPVLLWNRTETAVFVDVFGSENHQSNTYSALKASAVPIQSDQPGLLWHRSENIKNLKKITSIFLLLITVRHTIPRWPRCSPRLK